MGVSGGKRASALYGPHVGEHVMEGVQSEWVEHVYK